ncbi:replication initiator protein [Sigmofec virus UA08Rod_4820]|uniref:Replication initiator protein n=1 Tax=Sigmofec virus UA08Rod_4820 TaxID=2929410 RepID=A0A976N1C4_9VIRU|nr:replication initiator protein [Sigmofec virus UA08Rod_4820]
MACSQPVWIRNRRYSRKGDVGSFHNDDKKSAISLAPWDVSRQWLLVPCGRCEDCLRRLRNDWFVRIEREMNRCKRDYHQVIFITITIHPRHYDKALLDPSWFIRKWLERVRHCVGHSYKHIFFQEFGSHPEMGNEPRLHFHGFLFGLDIMYNELRQITKDLGFIWLAKANLKRARYCVKYVVKQIGCPPEAADKIVTVDGKPCKLSHLLQNRRYARRFVSAGLGDYLGDRPVPSLSVQTWGYLDFETGVCYNYAIPRYYFRYMSEDHKRSREILSADVYSRFSSDPLVRDIVDNTTKLLPSRSCLSRRNFYTWQSRQAMMFASAGCPIPSMDLPSFVDDQVLDFWQDEYDLFLIT